MRKAQAGATVLILLIGFFIILYILFLPPAERERILSGKNISTVEEGGGETTELETLLRENPGTLVKNKQDKIDHKIPSFNLFAKSTDTTLKILGAIYVESGSGSEKSRRFVVNVPQGAKNAQLTFRVNEHKGKLLIMVNDEEAFTDEVSGIVNIKLDLAKENIVEFKAEKAGFAFWSKNFYDIADAKVIATLQDTSSLLTESTVILSSDEVRNIDNAYLIYFLDCKRENAKRLTVSLNGAVLFSGSPDCSSAAKYPIAPTDLLPGKNTVTFSGEGGPYLIDQASIKTELKEPLFPIYYFELNDTQFGRIRNNTWTSELQLEFVDDKESHDVDLNINGHLRRVSTAKAFDATNIDSLAELGNNYIQLVPRKTVPIVEIKVNLRKVK